MLKTLKTLFKQDIPIGAGTASIPAWSGAPVS